MTQKCKLLGLLTAYQAELLLRLKSAQRNAGAEPSKPRDLGAYRGSHHAKTLATLSSMGHVTRKELSRKSVRPAYGYQITSQGLETLEFFTALTTVPPETVPGRAADRRALLVARKLCGRATPAAAKPAYAG